MYFINFYVNKLSKFFNKKHISPHTFLGDFIFALPDLQPAFSLLYFKLAIYKFKPRKLRNKEFDIKLKKLVRVVKMHTMK